MTGATGAAPASDGRDAADPSFRHLAARLGVVELRVQAAVERLRARDPEPGDAFRGLYVSDAHAGALLRRGPQRVPPCPDADALRAAIEAEADDLVGAGVELRLRGLERLGLDGIDVDLLLAAAAPDLDPRFEQLYGYLHDDVTRRRASVGLAIELAGGSALDPAARDRLRPSGVLVRNGLVHVEDDDRPYLGRAVRAADRVVDHLLGSDTCDARIERLAVDVPPVPSPRATPVARALANGLDLVYLRAPGPAGPLGVGAAAAREAGLAVVVADATGLHPAEASEVVDALLLEALLTGAVAVTGPVEDLGAAAVGRLADAAARVVLTGAGGWHDTWARRIPLVVEVGRPELTETAGAWDAALAAAGDADIAPPASFRLPPEQTWRAVRSARLAAPGAALTTADLARSARLLNSSGLERLARRVEPSSAPDDLVVPGTTRRALDHLIARVAHRGRVLDQWGLRRGGGRGEGITALFVGPSGTGKTLAAEAIAGQLRLSLYVVDLSTVVDKYVGETEKNLERIFAEAEGVNGVLFFDEADALFGKRSEIADAKDRYANIEVAYLLQRMERFDGLAIMASNLRANLDDAFTRRLSMIVEFAEPGPALRRELWLRCLGEVPLADDADVDFLADAFELSGGNIRNVAVAAAYLAADRDGPAGMAELIEAVQIEYRKLGRLCTPDEFGDHVHLLRLDEPEPPSPLRHRIGDGNGRGPVARPTTG